MDSQWEFTSSINCFVGDNGSGKTNILDAIHYLSLTKSYFNSNDSTSINYNSDFFTTFIIFCSTHPNGCIQIMILKSKLIVKV